MTAKRLARVAAAWIVLGGVTGLVEQISGQTTDRTPPPTRGGLGGGKAYRIYDASTIARGQSLFAAQCGFCHGSNAKGGESGPDLLRAVPVLDDEDGNLIAPIVLGGRVDRGMPKFSLTKNQIQDIAAFLHEGIRAAAQRGAYKLLDIVTGNAKAGERYFNGAGKCSGCHSVAGDLKGIGSKYDPVTLQGRFLMPRGGDAPAGTKSAPVIVTVKLKSGETMMGDLQHIDDFNVSLRDANGDFRSFDRESDVRAVTQRDPLQAHLDLLPKYTDADIHNLTAYLVTLK